MPGFTGPGVRAAFAPPEGLAELLRPVQACASVPLRRSDAFRAAKRYNAPMTAICTSPDVTLRVSHAF